MPRVSYTDLIELAHAGAGLTASASQIGHARLLEIASFMKRSRVLTIKNAHLLDQGQRKEIVVSTRAIVVFCFAEATDVADEYLLPHER
jgi:hypothetical protein